MPKDTGHQSNGARFRTRGSAFGRSTKIVLHLEDDQQEYLDEKHIKELVKKHSQFVNNVNPISLWIEKTTEKDIPDDEPDEDDEDEDVSLNIEVEVKEDDEKKLRRSPTSGG